MSESKPSKKGSDDKLAKIESENVIDEEKEVKPKVSFKSHFKDL